MSARKAVPSGSIDQQQVTVQARQTSLTLSPDSVIIHKGGIEFRSLEPFAPWTEMTMVLRSPQDGGNVHCSGVVISCTGSKHAGYHVSMVFTGMTKAAEARLSLMAQSQF